MNFVVNSNLWGPKREKRDRVMGHISERENGNLVEKLALLLDRSI